MRMHHLWIRLALKKLSWGVSFPKNWKRPRCVSSSPLWRTHLVCMSMGWDWPNYLVMLWRWFRIWEVAWAYSLFAHGRGSSKQGQDAMIIGDMKILRLIIYVQQVEEEKLRDREQYKFKKSKTGNESGHQKGGSNRPQFQKQKGLHHHLLVHLRSEKELSIMVRTPELCLHIHWIV